MSHQHVATASRSKPATAIGVRVGVETESTIPREQMATTFDIWYPALKSSCVVLGGVQGIRQERSFRHLRLSVQRTTRN